MTTYKSDDQWSVDDFAPLAIFAYRRPAKLRACLQYLAQCPEAKHTSLTVFVDGPKTNDQIAKVEQTIEVARGATGFKNVTVISRKKNNGLSNSIIGGVRLILEKEPSLIVVEDDLEVAPGFLTYMNSALQIYKDSPQVISVHGYCYPTTQELSATFFLRGADCWGWATWRRGWELFNADGDSLLRDLQMCSEIELFDFNGSANYLQMLKQQTQGKVDSWAIRWYASAFLANKLTLYPGESLVRNTGLDGTGTHGQGDWSHDVSLPAASPRVEWTEPIESAAARYAFESFFRNRRGGRKHRLFARTRATLRMIQSSITKDR